MNRIEFTEDLVSVLKGAPLSVLVLLMIARQPLSAQYLERRTRYSDKLIHSALLLLEEKLLITRNGRYSWQISANGWQLPLMNLIDESSTVQAPDSQGEGILSSDEDKSDEVETVEAPARSFHDLAGRSSSQKAGGVGISESEFLRVPSSSSRSLNLELKDLEVKELPLLERDPEFLRVNENLEACDAAGIREPKRSKLSKMPHVSAKLIRHHVSTAENIGMAIYRIEQNWRIKPGWCDPAESQSVCLNVCAQTFLPEVEKPDIAEGDLACWERALEMAKAKLRKVDFETWVKPVELTRAGADGWMVRAGNSHAAEWIRVNALGILEAAVKSKIEITW